jgi:serine protease
MGSGAVSPSHDSTTSIVTSSALPADCDVTRSFASPQVPRSIPDNNPAGAHCGINVQPPGLDVQRVLVSVNISHTYRGDLVIQLVSPSGEIATLSDRAGGSADNFIATDLDVSTSFTPGSTASGIWKLRVRDTAVQDTGTINSFSLSIASTN